MSGSSNSEESEDTINQYLQEHGLLEEGMTTDDKRSLWEVIKLSRDTAQAEEQDRQKRARKNLQFDEVSSRSDDGTKEEEKLPIVVAVSPRPRSSSHDSPHQNTATVLPFCYSPTSTSVSSSSRAHVTPVSPRQKFLSVDSNSRVPPKPVVEPSARRSLRLKPGESLNIITNELEMSQIPEEDSSILDKQNIPSPRNLKSPLSPSSVQNSPSPGQIQSTSINVNVSSPKNNDNMPSPTTLENDSPPEKELEFHSIIQNEHREASPRKWSEVVAGSSKSDLPSAFPSMELPCDESPTSSDHESSPVRRIRQGFSLSLKFPQSEGNSEECRALNEKEKSEPVPSPANEPPSNESTCPDNERKLVNDRERNIDAFSCDRSNYELALKVRKPRRMCSRLPFYIPPRKMDVHSYIAYFKKCVNDQAAKLLEVQKRSHKCVPWGDPVVVGEINSSSFASVTQKSSTAALPRYNFRDRRAIPQKVDSIYEDPSNQNDLKVQEEANDDFFDSLLDDKSSDAIQIIKKDESTENPKSNTATPERQGSKRKSESSDEMEEKRSTAGTWLIADKSEEEEVAVKRKKLETETVDEDESEIFAEITTVKRASSPKESHHEVEIIRPGPVKLRRNGRRRVQQISQQQNEADVTVVYEASNASGSNKRQEMEVPCPICRVSYPAKDIEAHASECNEYCAEDIPEDDEGSSSPQASSQDCWSQFDGVHEGNTQDNLRNILDGRMSPIRCFVPISAQKDSDIDYHNQFRIAQIMRPTLARGDGRRKKRKRTVKRKRKRTGGTANKKRKTATNINYFVKNL